MGTRELMRESVMHTDGIWKLPNILLDVVHFSCWYSFKLNTLTQQLEELNATLNDAEEGMADPNSHRTNMATVVNSTFFDGVLTGSRIKLVYY